MGDMGNTNPRVVAIAVAGAVVIGMGGWFAVKGLPSFSSSSHETRHETSMPGAPAGNAPIPAATMTITGTETAGETAEKLAKLASAHDAAAFGSHVDIAGIAKKAASALAVSYGGGDVSLPGMVESAFRGAVEGNIPANVSFCDACFGLTRTDFTGVARQQENGDTATVGVSLTGENIPNGFTLELSMKKQADGWHVVDVPNMDAYVQAVHGGRNEAARQYVEQENAAIHKYNETMNALKQRQPVVLSKEYTDGYEAAEQELARDLAALSAPESASELVKLRQENQQLCARHIALFREYLAGDTSEAGKQKRKDLEAEIKRNNQKVNAAIKRIKNASTIAP